MEVKNKRLINLINKQNLQEGLNDTLIPSLKIYKTLTAGEIRQSVYEPSLFVVLQGSKLVFIGGNAIEYNSASYLISSTYCPVAGRVLKATNDEPFLSLVINFTMEQIFETLEMFISKIEHSNTTKLAINDYKLDDALFDAVFRLAFLLENSEDIEFLENLYLKEILYRLLITNKNLEFRQFAFIEGNAYKISKAILFMIENLSVQISIEDICKHINMSIPSFHKHFKAITSYSPLQYIKMQKLQKAKSLMIAQNMDITGASYCVGYQSISQFSREYSKYFGLSPSVDIKNIKNKLSKNIIF